MRTFRERRESKKVKRIIPRRDLKDERKGEFKRAKIIKSCQKKQAKKNLTLRPALSSSLLFRE